MADLAVNRVEATIGASDQCELLLCTPGIGKVHAATAAALLVGVGRVDLLAVVGTAGRIDPTISGGAFLITEAIQTDYGAYRNGDFVPYRAGTLPIGPADTTPFSSVRGQHAMAQDPTIPTARIASGDSFVEDRHRSQQVAAASQASLVDMETAAVAQVAESLGCDWVAVKAVSDDANDDSATDFAHQLARASTQAAKLFSQVIGLT